MNQLSSCEGRRDSALAIALLCVALFFSLTVPLSGDGPVFPVAFLQMCIRDRHTPLPNGVRLVVDNAHGSHLLLLGRHPFLAGADYVVDSLSLIHI